MLVGHIAFSCTLSERQTMRNIKDGVQWRHIFKLINGETVFCNQMAKMGKVYCKLEIKDLCKYFYFGWLLLWREDKATK